MKNLPEISAYILCGGQSRRMGMDKAQLMYQGRTFVQHLVHVVEPLGCAIQLSSSHEAHLKYGLPVVQDLWPNLGPMGGIYSALQHANTETNLILACDLPKLTTKILIDLIATHRHERSEITVVESGGRLHPIIGVYERSLIPKIEKLIHQKDYRMNALLDRVKLARLMVPDSNLLMNVNNPSDYRLLN